LLDFAFQSLCTRFPTKLILRRSAEDSEERTKISIEPGDSRTEEEKNELRKFTESLTKPEDLGTYVKKASAVLGVLPPSSVADPPPVNLHGPPSNSDEDNSKFFTDDVLKIEKQGPNMPLLSLVDLPGLFQAESTEQDEASKEMVMRMVEKHIIKRKRSLILLVISAQIHTTTTPG
jgi:hypothetical protein